MATSSNHRWQFARSGGFDQARIESAADFANLEHLDLKLWAALACPVKGLEFDERTLAMIDADGDGRVRAPEIINAVQWCEDHLRDLAALKSGSDSLPLAQINDQTDSGKAILASARQLLKNVGKADATAITLADVAALSAALAQTNFNGDGVIPADAASDPAVKSVVENVIDCMGGATDRSGKPGLNEATLEAFFTQIAALNDWSVKGDDAALAALGAGTAAAADATKAVRAKINDYFARCSMAAFDARSLGAVNRQQEEYLAIASKDLSLTAQEIAGFPLSQITAGKALSLVDGVNPAWAGAIAAFHSAAVTPILGAGKTSITAADWAAINAKIAAYEAWAGSKPATAVEKLGVPRIREILAGQSKAAITGLIAQDKALEKEFTAIAQVEQLIRYYRDLYRLLNNFVNF
ncbi:MAG: hypothetical protein K8T90_00065 [Planctomycetes bacterium]|nr:hypothetical protein [Planctomycetota bacterium]